MTETLSGCCLFGFIGLCFAAGLLPPPAALAQEKATPEMAADKTVVRLWPLEMIGGEANRLRQTTRQRNGHTQVTSVKDPNLTIFLAASQTPTPAIVYCPGGAYKIVGEAAAEHFKEWLARGISVFYLKYSIPDKQEAAFKDIQRAVRLVRHNAAEWRVDPNRLGVVGNSAGAHLAARLTQNYDKSAYPPIDAADKMSCEPNFAVLQCAAYFNGNPPGDKLDRKLFTQKNKIAPTFLTYAKNDKWYPGGVMYVEALKKAAADIRFLVFPTGGHGMAGCDWVTPALTWLTEKKIIAPPPPGAAVK